MTLLGFKLPPPFPHPVPHPFPSPRLRGEG